MNDSKQPSAPAPASSPAPPPVNPAAEKKAKPSNNGRSRALWWFTGFLILAALIWLCLWFFYLRFYESTDDAYANGNYININSVISGAVVAFYADNTDLVEEGQLLVRLDDTNYRVIYEKELATLAQVTLQVRGLFDNVQTAHDTVANRRAVMNKAKIDFDDRLKLIKSNREAVSKEDYIHAGQDYDAARYDYEQVQSQVEAAISAAGNAPPEKHPLIEQQKGNVRTAYYNLQHCSIYAPSRGYVAQRSVDVGQWLTPTTNLMAVIPVDYVWVDANYKETQLDNMRIGQPAVVWFDLYGRKVKYHGKVIGIASGSGSVFSLIPPQNATGNWIKIVQRLPVRISLDPETLKDFPSRLGISAEVSVNITDQNLPMLALVPPSKPVSKTGVFDIDMEKVNQLMDTIVGENLAVRAKKTESSG